VVSLFYFFHAPLIFSFRVFSFFLLFSLHERVQTVSVLPDSGLASVRDIPYTKISVRILTAIDQPPARRVVILLFSVNEPIVSALNLYVIYIYIHMTHTDVENWRTRLELKQ
jgi:hypothetical protein